MKQPPSLYFLLVTILVVLVNGCGNCNNYGTNDSKGSPTRDSTKLDITEPPPVKNQGIGNIGNSCYFASTTQILASFYRGLIEQPARDPKNKVAGAGNELIKSLTTPTSESAKIKTQAKEFLNSLEKDEADGGIGWKDSHDQQDASELLTKILDLLNLPMLKISYKLVNRVTQEEKPIKNTKYPDGEPFTKLELHLSKDTSQTMQEVVKEFFTPEVIDDYKWDEAKDEHSTQVEKVSVVKGIDNLYNGILIVNVKRFGYDMVTNKDFKIDKPIEQPFHITLTQEKSPGSQQKISYDLVGFINHSGSTGGGHYIAHVKVNATWVKYDDASVQEVSENQAKDTAKKGYTFFYRQVK